MSDINCRQCGEPYSAYSLRHEVSDWEDQPDDAYDRFMSGEGCPTCNWGENAGDVSLSRSQSDDELKVQHIRSAMEGTDEDPLKFF